MTNVIIEATKSYIGDVRPSATAKLKELTSALKELERARKTNYDEGETSLSDTDYDSSGYYTGSYTESSSRSSILRRTSQNRGNGGENEKPDNVNELDWTNQRAVRRYPETKNLGRLKSAAVARPEEERRRKRRIEKIAEHAKTSRSADDKLVLSYMFDETAPMHFRRTLDRKLIKHIRTCPVVHHPLRTFKTLTRSPFSRVLLLHPPYNGGS